MKSVLLLTVYPIDNPRHGGQHRAHHIMEKYQNLGFKVTSIYVACESDSLCSLGTSCFPLDQESVMAQTYFGIHEVYDYTIGMAAANSLKFKDKLFWLISNGDYEIIHIEQPWLFESVYRLKCEQSDSFNDVALVYGSQNIEHELKSAMIDKDHPKYAEMVNDIRNVEIKAAKLSDYVLAVSKHDQDRLLKYNANTFLARNGVGKKTLKSKDYNYVEKMIGNKPYFLFVGSAHKPNCDGFISMIGGAMGCIPPYMDMVLVGGVNLLFEQDDEFIKWQDINRHKIKQLQDVTDSQLQAVIDGCSAILLPICSGGGTNLKTAEALLSNKKIIATKMSFRDFESYIDNDITIADSRQEFQAAIRSFIPGNIYKKRKDSHLLLWENTLRDIETIVRYKK